jgi:transcriptional regulator with XRE-family HTH domain
MDVKGYDIVERIDSELRKLNKKRLAVCEYANISTQSLTDWSRRGSIPAADTLLLVADYLGVSYRWLLTGEDDGEFSPRVYSLAKKIESLEMPDFNEVENMVDFKLKRYTKSDAQTEELA